MSSTELPNGLYEIYASGTNVFLSILHDVPNAAIVLVPYGTAHAAQLWEVQSSETGQTTLRNVRHGAYASFHGALPGHPLLGAAKQREWYAELQQNCFGQHDEYTLKVYESPDAVPAPTPAPAAEEPAPASAESAARESGPVEPAVEWVWAGVSKLQIYPLPTVLRGKREGLPQVWTFRRVWLASEARHA